MTVPSRTLSKHINTTNTQVENRLPVWFRQQLPSKEVLEFSGIIRDRFKLNTICHSAKCPNQSICFAKGHATFLILGDRCTRNCLFCNVEKNQPSFVDSNESSRLARVVKFLNLEYVVITSVTRDDLADGGAKQFVRTIKAIRKFNPDVRIEVLVPDFGGSFEALEKIIDEKPDVISHNLETVKRIYPLIRDKANYERSLNVLRNIKSVNPFQITKSSIMLGLGGTDLDLKEALEDLRSVECDMLVLGQYLRPSLKHYPIQKFYSPQEFKSWERFAYDLGFKSVCAQPLARTSYLAKEQEKCCTMS